MATPLHLVAPCVPQVLFFFLPRYMFFIWSCSSKIGLPSKLGFSLLLVWIIDRQLESSVATTPRLSHPYANRRESCSSSSVCPFTILSRSQQWRSMAFLDDGPRYLSLPAHLISSPIAPPSPWTLAITPITPPPCSSLDSPHPSAHEQARHHGSGASIKRCSSRQGSFSSVFFFSFFATFPATQWLKFTWYVSWLRRFYLRSIRWS